MGTNLTTHYLAITTERARLPKQAEHGWNIEQAIARNQRPIGPTSLRRWVGGLLIAAAQRVQGVPEVEILATTPNQPH